MTDAHATAQRSARHAHPHAPSRHRTAAATDARPGGPDDRPVIRVLHTLARTGGTVIGKCLAVMPQVLMLSEVNPAVTKLLMHPLTRSTPDVMQLLRRMDPLYQAHLWFKLLTDGDLDALRRRAELPPFEEAIAMIQTRVAARGGTLVLRDWAHLDFAAAPFLARPTHRLSTSLALAPNFRLLHAAFVRHPIDQWLSIQNIPMLRERLSLAQYLEGCRRFAEEAVKMGFVRYEDFARDPGTHVRTMCHRLSIAFDPTYRDRWATYHTITGDTKGTRAQSEIVVLPRRPIEDNVIAEFGRNADYLRTLELLGYSHP